MRTYILNVLLLLSAVVSAAHADVVTQDIEYHDGETVLKGYLAYDDTLTEPVPGVLICHQWMGLSDHEKQTARRLAKDGYVAFALDIYGVDNRPSDRSGAGKVAGQFYSNRPLLRKRAQLGLEQLRGHSWSDDNRLAAIGFCFGGSTVLELARSGADIQGVVSIHGGLDTPNPSDARNITCKVLALHGGDDPHVPLEEVNGFVKEMRDADVDWDLIMYGGAVHSFTQPSAGNDPSKGSAYNADAARDAWQHMNLFFREIFKMEPDRRNGTGAWSRLEQ